MASNALIDRIQHEMRGRSPDKILDLNLDGCKTATFEGFPVELNKLQFLSAINMGLKSADGLPDMPDLKLADFADNHIDDLTQLAEKCPNLENLMLVHNAIKTLDVVKPLQKLAKLEHLDLDDNEIMQIPSYREEIFKLLPNLKYLDGVDAAGEMLEDSDMEDFEDEESDSDISLLSDEEGIESDEEVRTAMAHLQAAGDASNKNATVQAALKAQNGEATAIKTNGEKTGESAPKASNDTFENTPTSDSQNRGMKRKHENDNAGPQAKI